MTARPPGQGPSLARWLPLLAILAVMTLALSLGWHRYLSLGKLAQHYEDLRGLVAAHRAFALLGFVALYVLTATLSLPGSSVLTMCGGFLFGWLLGSLATVLGATAGATLLFLVARSSLGEALAERAGPRLDRLREGFARDAFSYLLFLRLVPAFPFWLVNLASAFLGVPLRVYVLATALGIIPGTIVFAVVGSGLDGVIQAERAAYEACMAAPPPGGCRLELHVRNLVSPGLLAAFAGLGLLALLPVALKKVKEHRADEASGARGRPWLRS